MPVFGPRVVVCEKELSCVLFPPLDTYMQMRALNVWIWKLAWQGLP